MSRPQMHDFHSAALRYHQLGLSVIPCVPDGKEPAFGWSQYMKERPSILTINNWWTGARRGAPYNLAVVCGRVSGCIVLDFDPLDGVPVEVLVEAFERRFGKLPHTATVRTPHDRRHIYLALPEGVKGEEGEEFATTVIDFPGLGKVELRGEGSIAVMPPSVVDDRQYEWLIPPTQDTLAPVPSEILAAMRRRERSAMVDRAAEPDQELLSRAQRLLEDLSSDPSVRELAFGDFPRRRVKGRDRSEAAYKLACLLLARHPDFLDTRLLAAAVYLSAAHRSKFENRPDRWEDALRCAERAAAPPPDEQAYSIAVRAARAVVGAATSSDESPYQAARRAASACASAGIPDVGVVAAAACEVLGGREFWPAAASIAREVLGGADGAAPTVQAEPQVGSQAEPQEGVTVLGGIAVIDAAYVTEERVEWLIEGLLPKGALAVLAGRPKLGKTSVLLYLVAQVLRGEPFAGLRTTQTGILALMYENARSEIVADVKGYGVSLNGSGPRLHLPMVERTTSAPDWLTIFTLAQRLGCGLVIVDPLAVVKHRSGGKGAPQEGSYEAVYEKLIPVLAMTKATGISVIAVTHAAKGRSVIRDVGDVIDAPIGSSAYAGAPDVLMAWGIHPDGRTERRLLATGRYRAGCDLTFTWDGRRYSAAAPSGPQLSALATRLLEHMNSNPRDFWTLRALGEAVGRSKSDVREALSQLLEHGLVSFTKKGERLLWHPPTEFIIRT